MKISLQTQNNILKIYIFVIFLTKSKDDNGNEISCQGRGIAK